MHPFRRAVFSVFATLSLTACASNTPPPTSQIIKHQENLRTEQNQARQVDPSAKVVGKANSVVVREIRTQTVGEKMLVDFVLFNDRGKRDVINYRLRWLDPNGMTVSQYDPWESVALEGHEQSVLSVSAPIAQASDFRIEIKPNN